MNYDFVVYVMTVDFVISAYNWNWDKILSLVEAAWTKTEIFLHTLYFSKVHTFAYFNGFKHTLIWKIGFEFKFAGIEFQWQWQWCI